MPAVAEYICQACGKITWSAVPVRTDTMPACACGGRRQIVRIRHRLPSDEAPERLSEERLQRTSSRSHGTLDDA